ncbi:MAG TPA: prephenate dehydrogenase/arogenate dehydrogenase family protein [Candidatus Acidoferrum sp.]|nr:prephenate dehydrogenase/arogenate dehydrogenase family protein [Candidatus Acidoferrum sp.]
MSEPGTFRGIAVLGVGLIGGSFALAARREAPGAVIAGFDREENLAKAKARGAIDESCADVASAVHNADLIYIALPVVAAMESLRTIAEHAPKGALVTDACSTKGAICRAALNVFKSPDGPLFLGGHPMAGKEAPGVEQADADLFRGAQYALIGSGPATDERVRRFLALIEKMGATPVWCDAETHDWAVGVVSHLPQMVSIALARVIEDETDETGLPVSLAGAGLRDALRLAASPYSMWRDICLTNTENVRRALDRMEQALEYLRTHLASRELEAEFRGANELCKSLQKGQ